MHVIVIKYWMNKLFKSISFGAISLEINQLNIHCSTLGSVFLSVLNKGPSCRHFAVSWRSCDTNVMITLCGSSLHDKDADRQLDGLELVAAMRHGYDHQMEQLGHDVQFPCAIDHPLLAHHWRVHPCLLTSRFIAPSIPLGVSTLVTGWGSSFLRTITFLIIHWFLSLAILLLIYLLFKKHCIQYISIWKIVWDLVKGTWHHNFMAGCGSLLWANTCSLSSGIKSWPGAGCLQRLVRRR